MILSSGNLLQFLINLRDGWMVCDVITSPERLSELKGALEEKSVFYEICSVMQSKEPVGLLTDRQQRLLIEAVERGYYEVPRQVTHQELAEECDRCQSTIAEHLQKIEATVLPHVIQ